MPNLDSDAFSNALKEMTATILDAMDSVGRFGEVTGESAKQVSLYKTGRSAFLSGLGAPTSKAGAAKMIGQAAATGTRMLAGGAEHIMRGGTSFTASLSRQADQMLAKIPFLGEFTGANQRTSIRGMAQSGVEAITTEIAKYGGDPSGVRDFLVQREIEFAKRINKEQRAVGAAITEAGLGPELGFLEKMTENIAKLANSVEDWIDHDKSRANNITNMKVE